MTPAFIHLLNELHSCSDQMPTIIAQLLGTDTHDPALDAIHDAMLSSIRTWAHDMCATVTSMLDDVVWAKPWDVKWEEQRVNEG